MPVEHCLQNDTRPVKTSFTPLISVISVCFEYPSCTLQSFQHVIDFNLRVKIAVRILCTLPASLCGLLMGRKFTVWPWIFSLLELEPLLFFSAGGQLLAPKLLCLVCAFFCDVHQQHLKFEFQTISLSQRMLRKVTILRRVIQSGFTVLNYFKNRMYMVTCWEMLAAHQLCQPPCNERRRKEGGCDPMVSLYQ